MGYDLHITRREYWDESENAIEAAAWLAYVASDASLSLQPDNGPYFVLWISPDQQDRSEPDWLDWFDGQLYSKVPSSQFRKKMFTIAEQLGAVVQGDEGELYNADGEKIVNGVDIDHTDSYEADRSKSLWCILKAKLQRISLHNPLGVPYCTERLWFKEGDTVLDCWANEQIIVKIDRKAFHGEGAIVTKDTQGNESIITLQSYHSFKPLVPKK